MIKGSVKSNPIILEYLPDDYNDISYNQGYAKIIMKKIEEMEKKGIPVISQTLKKELSIGKTTVNKHLQNYVKQGLLVKRKAKIAMEGGIECIGYVYQTKRKNAK